MSDRKPWVVQIEPLTFARLFKFVYEIGQNAGRWVLAFQKWRSDENRPPESYCADFVTFCMEVAGSGESPFGPLGSVASYMAKAEEMGILVSIDEANRTGRIPVPGRDLFCIHDGTRSHIGFVAEYTPNDHWDGISGNTSRPDGTEGVDEHRGEPRSSYHFILTHELG